MSRDTISTVLTVSVAILALVIIGVVVYGVASLARRRVRAWNASFDTGGAGSYDQEKELRSMRAARTTEIPRVDMTDDPVERHKREEWRRHMYEEITEINDRFEQLTAQFEPIVWRVNVAGALDSIAPELAHMTSEESPETMIAWALRPNDLPPPPWRQKRVPLMPLAKALKLYERELATASA
jgi:hypothetical protein